jgi:hypothetical protein
MSQRVVQYQAVLQLAQTAPQIYDMPVLHRQMLDVLGIKNANKLVPIEDDELPTDPIQENQNAITGKPLKAFIEQNHSAHIQVHMNAMQDPKIAQIIGQNPQAQAIQAAMMAHIQEHVAFEYRMRIEEEMGIPLPTEEQNKKVDPAFANQLAAMASEAAQKLFKQHTQEAQQQMAQQQLQDPVIQMQQQELAIKGQEQQRKANKDQTDAQLKTSQQEIERERIAAQERIAAEQRKTDLLKEAARLEADKSKDQMGKGVDILKHLSTQHTQERQQDIMSRQANQKPKQGGNE